MAKIIVITSGKGGVGKTTTSINLGAAMKYFGINVLVVDGNLSTPNIGVYLNSPEVPINLNHVLLNKAELSEAIYEHDSGLKIIPSSLSLKELNRVKPEKLKSFVREFKKLADYIILDCSAGLNKEAISAIETGDELIIVTNPELPAITDALKTIKLAEKMKKSVLGVIITRVRKDRIEMQPIDVKDMLEVPILGMIPEDFYIKKSLNVKNSVVNAYPKSNAARAYKEIASKIVGANYDSNLDKEKLFERIKRRIRDRKDFEGYY